MAENERRDNNPLERNEPERKNYQLKLPLEFEAKREEFYSTYSKVLTAHFQKDELIRNDELAQYLERVNYLITRIMPKIREEDRETLIKIQNTTLHFIETYDGDFLAGLNILNENHQTLNKILYDYDLAKITLEDFNAW